MRAHRLFRANHELDCCPSATRRNSRTFAVNKHGIVIELFQMDNATQEFFETVCSGDSEQPATEKTTQERCKFVDPRLAPHSRCVQQWSYVSAVGRPYKRPHAQLSLHYVRIRTGCKCRVSARAVAALQEHSHSTTDIMLPPQPLAV